MSIALTCILLLASSLLVLGQQVGKHTPEVHPKLTWQQCKAGGTCTTMTGGVTMDAQWRWVHNEADKNCFQDGHADATLCPDEATCAKNCAYEGIDYKSQGVSTSGSHLTMTLKPGSRLYLTQNDSHYQQFHVLDQEFSFDVDISKVPCGGNAALYLVAMEADGGVARSHGTNKAGAKYGMGYCDSQCPKNLNFNQAGHGACCSETDIWEANKEATALTLHPCSPTVSHLCEGAPCTNGICEQYGCGANPYGAGSPGLYGPGKTVDTNKVFTVVTQFITSGGALSEIKRFYVQGGKVITDPHVMNEKFCTADVNHESFNKHGGLKQMGEGLKAGKTLAFALWDDPSGHMKWLDSGKNGPCTDSQGDPASVEAGPAVVVFSNIKVGPINSTFHH